LQKAKCAAFRGLASSRKRYQLEVDALEDAVTKIDRIAQMLNCPEKGEELRRAITESRKDFLLNQLEDIVEDDVLEDEVFEDDEDDDEYDEFDWTTE
jgi:phosphopantothenoylcysteine synthetase/decarboxylase